MLTTTAIDHFPGIRDDLLTPAVLAALYDYARARSFHETALDDIRSAAIAVDEAHAAYDFGAARAAQERLDAARQVDRPVALTPEGGIAVRDVVAGVWQTFRAAMVRRPTEFAADHERGRVEARGRDFRPLLDSFAADPCGGSQDVIHLLRVASQLLDHVDAYLAEHGNASTTPVGVEFVPPAPIHRPDSGRW
jgi:hypothetical protein